MVAGWREGHGKEVVGREAGKWSVIETFPFTIFVDGLNLSADRFVPPPTLPWLHFMHIPFHESSPHPVQLYFL